MNINKIGLFGFRKNGQALYKSLIECGIEVSFVLERNYEALFELEEFTSIPIVDFKQDKSFYNKVDAIILSEDIPNDICLEILDLIGVDCKILSKDEIKECLKIV